MEVPSTVHLPTANVVASNWEILVSVKHECLGLRSPDGSTIFFLEKRRSGVSLAASRLRSTSSGHTHIHWRADSTPNKTPPLS